MLERLRTAVSKSRLRQQEAARRRSQRRSLRAERLEGRLLLTGDSWVVPTGIPSAAGSYVPVAADSAGSVYVAAGRRDGSATAPDAVLTKYLPNGQLDWTKDFRLAATHYITDVVVGLDSVYIVGGFDGTVNLDPTDGDPSAILQSSGGQDGYLAKYGADGAFLWAHQWGGTGNDRLQDVAVSGDCVFVTGKIEISVKNKVQTDQLIASVTDDGLLRWEKTVGLIGGAPPAIAVFTPPSAPPNIYITGAGGVAKYTESVAGNDALLAWTYDLGENISMAGYGGIAVGGGDPTPSLYVLTQGAGTALLRISDEGDIGHFVWSTSMDAYPWGVTVDGTTVYVTGRFSEQADFSGTRLTSRGDNDGFLARYGTDGQLLTAQRMGGSAMDEGRNIAVGNGRVYVGGFAISTNGDFPAGLPGAMSAFVGDPQGDVFVMQLDPAAPIVQMAESDISVAPGASVTLAATISPGASIAWYDKDGLALTDPVVNTPTFTPDPAQLLAGSNQFSAVATDSAGRIGMAGVLVTVMAPTKFYVVDDMTANQTFEYSDGGALNESYSLTTGNTAPRGAASTAAGNTTWVVDASRKVYVYNTSGGLLRTWTAGTLSTKAAKVEGIATNGTDVWIVDAYSDKVYRYANGATAASVTLAAASSFALNSGNINPKDIVTDGVSIWVLEDNATDKVFKYTMSGALIGSWTIIGGGGSPTGITLDPSNASQDLWIVDVSSQRVYRYANGRDFASGTQQTAAEAFALAPGNRNPQGIADPPTPSNSVPSDTGSNEQVEQRWAQMSTERYLWVHALGSLPVAHSALSIAGTFRRGVQGGPATIGLVGPALANSDMAAQMLDIRSGGEEDDRLMHQRQSRLDDVFAQWDSDPLGLLTLP